MRIVSTKTRKYFLAIVVSLAVVTTAQTAFAKLTWSSATTVTGWNIHVDASGNGNVELYTSPLGGYTFPLDTIGTQILAEIRDAKKSGHQINIRQETTFPQMRYCFTDEDGQEYCNLRVWGVSQIQ